MHVSVSERVRQKACGLLRYVTTKEDRNFETFVTFADSMDAGCSYLDEPSFDILEWAGIRAPFCSNLQRGLPTGAVQPMAV